LTSRVCSVLLCGVSGDAERIAVLEAENARLRALVEAQAAIIDELRAQVADLERRLAKSSQNSSMPPSRDDEATRASRQQRREAARKERKAARRAGKQPGSPGATLMQRADPDEVVVHRPGRCGACGMGLEGAARVGVVRRQVFDLPQPAVVCTEHAAHKLVCGCGHITTAGFPAWATGPACWGPNIAALATYLLVRQHLPVARCAQMLGHLGANVSVGWVASQVPKASGRLAGWLAGLRDRLATEPVLHADETSGRIAGGGLWWFHVVSTPLLSLLVAHRSRGRAAVDDIGVLARRSGRLVHDRLALYWAYGADHAVCGAHLIRDLAGIAEVPGHKAWCEQMTKALLAAKAACDTARSRGQPHLSPAALTTIDNAYQAALGAALNATASDHPHPKGPQRDAANLACALHEYQTEILAYTRDLGVPFTNNQAERDLRMVKLQQKISGGWRTQDGIKAFADIRSYIDTARKHGHNPLHALTQLLTTSPWTIPTT
jgi:transposase